MEATRLAAPNITLDVALDSNYAFLANESGGLRVVDVAGPVLEAQIWEATRPGVPMPPALISELADRGGIRPEAFAYANWAPLGEPGWTVGRQNRPAMQVRNRLRIISSRVDL